ncbi:hypothetical protein GGR54DRAFT_301782 [Hypoxylon sp. NC1633]|nr:hypothetical protein GGR54DRAFT_301782 [Hypoxylon sp. NC1633]
MADSEDISPPFRVYVIIMSAVTVIALLLRFLSRTLISVSRNANRLWWDDWAAASAGVFVLSLSAIDLVAIQHGFGRHIQTLTPHEASLNHKLILIADCIFDIALSLTKLSALLFYSRVFPGYANSKSFNATIWTAHALNLAWLVGMLLGTLLTCKPVEKVWNPSVPGICNSYTHAYIGSAISSVFVDLIILILPLPKIWRLRTSTTQKMGVTSIFVFGSGIIVASLGRMITVVTSGRALDTDPTYAGIEVFYWASAEVPISVLCICLPATLPLGRHLSRQYIEPLANKVSSFFGTQSRRNTSNSRSRAVISSKTGTRLRLNSNDLSRQVDSR